MKYSMKHNIMAILISVLMVFAMMPVMSGAVFADSIQSEGNCGARESESDPCADNAKYTFDESSGALVISGTGEIGIGAFKSMSNKDKITSITINKGITTIGKNAFEGATACDALILPATLKSIGKEAFYNCFALKAVKLPDSLETIGEAAFYNDNIETVVIPAGVTEFYWDAFGREPSKGSLKKITIKAQDVTIRQRTETSTYNTPSTITTAGPIGGGYDYEFAWTTKIPGRAFSEIGVGGENSLERVVIPDTVTEIGENAFYKAKRIKSVDLPAGLTAIGEYCFAEMAISSIDLPDGVTVIPDYAFENTASLGTLPVSDSVTEIGYAAFHGCTGLDSITIPDSVETIKGDAFYACSLSDVSVLNPSCAIRDDVNVFNNNGGSKPNIKGYDGSAAQSYAEKYSYTFESLGPAPVSIKDAKVVLSASSYTYNGKIRKPVIKTIGGRSLKEGTDYTAKWSNASSKNAGSYTVTIKGKGKYIGTTKASYKIVKAANTLSVKGRTAAVSYGKLKKGNQTLTVGKAITFSNKGQGTRTYKLVSAKKGSKSFIKKFAVNKKNGSIIVRRGLQKGTYKVRVNVTAAGGTNYKGAVKPVTATVIVR